MEGASEGVNQEMKESQAVAGFDYSDFEASIANFDSSFQVIRLTDLQPASGEHRTGAAAGAMGCGADRPPCVRGSFRYGRILFRVVY